MTSDILHRSRRTIAQGALTNSKHPDRFVGSIPSHVKYGFGCHLIDMNDQKWLDMICGLGTNHFGYGNQKIQKELLKYSFHGNCHSLPTFHEIEATEKLKQLFTFVDKVKWVNDGSSGCTAACIMARAYTGRSRILTSGYHGWHPEQISPVSYKPDGNSYSIKKFIDIDEINSTIACVIMEPVELDDSRDRIDFLKNVRNKCTEHGVVLIFDEVITGIRYNNFGVSNNFGFSPDMIILGKAMANGEKIAAVCGQKDLMDGDYFVSGTYHGHLGSLAAANVCMHMAKFDPTYDLKRLNSDSLIFYDALNDLADGLFEVNGWGCRGAFTGDYYLYFQQMAKAKILFGPSIFINFDSVKYLSEILEYSQIALDNIINNRVKLEGEKPTSAFSSQMRKKNG